MLGNRGSGRIAAAVVEGGTAAAAFQGQRNSVACC